MKLLRSWFSLLFVAACSSSSPSSSPSSPGGGTTTPPAPVASNVGAAGGKVASPAGDLEVEIPAGALDADTKITIDPIASPVAGAIGQAYEIGPTGTTFKTPVTLRLHFKDADLGTTTPDKLVVSTVKDGKWQAISAAVLDPSTKTVTGTTTHLSPYALSELVGTAPPPDAQDPRCQKNVPVMGDFCNVTGLKCAWEGTMGYCDGTNWTVAIAEPGCPVTSPANTNASCGTFAKTCAYLVGTPGDCTETCQCSNGKWFCPRNCECIPASEPETGTVPGSGQNGACPASTNVTCVAVFGASADSAKTTCTCTSRTWECVRTSCSSPDCAP